MQEHLIQSISFGRAVFKNMPRKNKEIIEKQKELLSTLSKIAWNLNYGNYEKYNCMEIFPYMSECYAEQIFIRDNNHFNILKQIQNAQYSKLKWLYLGYNNIQNVQSLSFIEFKCLSYFVLSDNKISRIEGMNKLSIPSLNIFSLQSNPILEINALSEAKINPKQFLKLFLSFFSNQNPIQQDLSVIVKFSSEQYKKIFASSNLQIKQPKIQTMLKLRFPTLIQQAIK